MKMRSSNYWRRREEEALQHYITEEEDYDRQIQQIYKTMLANIQTEIDAFYGRYATKEGITLQEAKKRVSQADIEAYARKAKEYVARKDLSDIANEEMRLYNLKMKVNRLEMLKARIGMEVTVGTDEMDKHMGAVLKKRVYDELKRQAGILGHTVVNNEELAHVIPNASFHGATFSERLWRQDKQMMEDLSRLLQSGLIRGKNPRVLAQEIRRYFVGDTRLKNSGGVIFNAERLMRTELARVQTAAQKASFEANGFTQYEYIANSRCCDACQALDGKHFDVADMMPGENAAPLHPNCRCSVAAYDDGEEYQKWLKEVENSADIIPNLRIRSSESKKISLEYVYAGKAGLNKHRKNLFNRTVKSGDWTVISKDSVTLDDLAYLSAYTKHEYALWEGKNDVVLHHGSAMKCDPPENLSEKIFAQHYKLKAHTHVDKGKLVASNADRETLRILGQTESILVGIDGKFVKFGPNIFD